MPYLGNNPATQFAELKYQDFTGGTGTSFTLNDPVGTAQELEVFVNNVRQEPGVAYTVSGTALTMTGSIVATDDFYVVFQGKSTGTATHPAGQALTATDGTFTGNLDVSSGTIKLDGNYPTGTENTALGDTALDSVQSGGNYNVAVGSRAGTAITTGDENVAVGAFALDALETGSNNTAIGTSTLGATTGSDNTAVGANSGSKITSGASNTSIGKNALKENLTGNDNVAVGQQALEDNTASNNTALGYAALLQNTTGTGNVAVGKGALDANTTASNNTAVGLAALGANTTGADNTAVGNSCAESITTGIDNTIIGQNAGRATTTGSYNVFVGLEAADDNTTGNYNTYVGHGAGDKSTVSSANTFIGNNAGGGYNGASANTFNTFLGCDSGQLISTGQKNVILGSYNGNSNNLDIRTSNKFVVLSDGDGIPRGIFDGTGQFMVNFGQGSDVDGKIGASSGSTTFGVQKTDGLRFAHNGSSYWNRFGNGVIIYFRRAGTNQGSIQVSGSTVSYVGGHLSRWSQLADNTRDASIVKGTVMTNLDQMAEWTKDGVTEDNEQLNCMAVSSVEGDANVAGVFVSWDDDDPDYDNDMTVAMTGDMVIRIAQGTTVARGDLLMSAGDGTAKPQGDDIVRSKTIAKVTSTNVSHTYDDGSYLVPCVLMAC